MRALGDGCSGDWARLAADRAGSTAIEYTLIASIVAIFAISALLAFGGSTGTLYGSLRRISAAMGGGIEG